MAEKIAVVTGSNRGLGLAIVKLLCERYQGFVYITSRNETAGLEAVKKLNDLGLKPLFHQLDVCSADSVKNFAEFLKNKHGGLDVLVNNAAVLDLKVLYPNYEQAKQNIDTNYKSLLTIEEHIFPLLRDGARVVNISSACGHLSNLRGKNKKWIDVFTQPDFTLKDVNSFVEEYLDSVRNGTFDRNDFADDGKHAEHRVSKIALTALTKILQKKYPNISVNAVHPGHINTEVYHGGNIEVDEAAEVVMYLIFDASPKLKGVFMWHNRKIIDWYDADNDLACKGIF